MSDNPYQSPLTDSADRGSSTNQSPTVDGDALVVYSQTVLPPICVRTNQPVSEKDMIRGRYTWCPPWVVVFVFLGGLPLILVYFLARKHCILTYGLHPSQRKRYRKRMLIKIALAIVLFLMIPILSATNSVPVIVVAVLLFLAAIVSMFVGNSPLRVVRYRGKQFWIKGCSEDYMARISLETAS